MKNLVWVLLLAGLQSHAYGQCPDRPFQAVTLYYQANQGGGIEAGLWPVETSRLGGFLGLGLIKVPGYAPAATKGAVPAGANKDLLFNTYIKGQFRISRYLNVTATAGLLDFEKAYYQAGLRGTIPFNDHSLSAIVIEPQYGSLGFVVQAGVGFKIRN
jgi:hypothetical protein